MGLSRQEGAHSNAFLPRKRTQTIPTSPPNCAAGPTAPHIKKQYGAKVQHAKPHDDTPPLDKAGKKFIKEVTGVFLYLVRAVDSTMLTPLRALAFEQAAPTENTMQDCLQFLDYAASQEDAIVTY